MNPVFQYTFNATCNERDLEVSELSGLPQRPNDKWYFWEETWCDANGPYDTEAEAVAALEKYVREVLG